MNLYTARQLPVQRGLSGWNALLGPAPDPRNLQDKITADFAIVGAGFAGLSAARRLTQLVPDAKIAVLDAGRLAEGAAGRNSGFMTDLPQYLSGVDQASAKSTRQLIALNRQAQDFAGDVIQDYDITPDYFDRAGKINGASDFRSEAILESEARHLSMIGEDFEVLDGKAMHHITGSHFYFSGLYTPGTVMLQPAGYIRGLAAGLARARVSIFEDSAVTGFERTGPDWTVKTTKGQVSAGKVILAVNGHLESFGVAKNRLIQLFLFGAITSEMRFDQIISLGGQERWAITSADPMGTSVRRIDTGQGGNRLLIKTTAAVRSNMTAHPSDLERAQSKVRKSFNDRFPFLKGLTPEHVWAGHLCLSRNGVAVMRELDDGVFSACVQNGLGTARGTLTGIAAAELACGQTSAITTYFANEPKPKILPPKPLRDFGGNAALRWKEWRARRA